MRGMVWYVIPSIGVVPGYEIPRRLAIVDIPLVCEIHTLLLDGYFI